MNFVYASGGGPGGGQAWEAASAAEDGGAGELGAMEELEAAQVGEHLEALLSAEVESAAAHSCRSRAGSGALARDNRVQRPSPLRAKLPLVLIRRRCSAKKS